MIVLAFLAALFLPADGSARETSRRARCANNLKQIGLALFAYQNVHGCLPPAYLADETGHPMHSWRVLILPFLDDPKAQSIYDRYDFSQPWDAPANLALAKEIPKPYVCTVGTDDNRDPSVAHCAAVTGPDCRFFATDTPRLDEVTDGAYCTIMVAETNTLITPWTAPVDVDGRYISHRFDGSGKNGISSHHPRGANFLFVDGSIHFLDDRVPQHVVTQLLTPAGGEIIKQMPF